MIVRVSAVQTGPDHVPEKRTAQDAASQHQAKPTPLEAEFAPVSAVVPVADRPQLLADALRSICSGSMKPRELIVVLNAKTPGRAADRQAAEKVFAEYSAAGIELHLIECEDTGPGPARNAGVAAARQDWLAFLDSDDLWAPDKLRRQWRYLRQRPYLQAAHTAERWIKDGRELNQPAHLRPHTGRFLVASFSHCLISCSSFILRRELFAALNGFDPAFRVCEDFELWLRLLVRHPVGLLREALTIKRAGDWPQESRRFHSLDALRIRAILKLVRNAKSELKPQELAAARAACESKLAILKQGARRRDRAAELTPLVHEIRSVFPGL